MSVRGCGIYSKVAETASSVIILRLLRDYWDFDIRIRDEVVMGDPVELGRGAINGERKVETTALSRY